MSVSKRTKSNNLKSITFDIDSFSANLERRCPEIVFAYLLGSATEGTIAPSSDLDLAVFIDEKPTMDTYQRIIDATEPYAGGAEIDLGFLKNNEPVYRFEALKGRLLFTRNQETWLRFYSLTCREYEHWLFHYEKQRRYRIEYGA